MITIPKNRYFEELHNFAFATLLSSAKSGNAQIEIRKECNDVLAKDIYNPNITKPMKVNEFNQI